VLRQFSHFAEHELPRVVAVVVRGVVVAVVVVAVVVVAAALKIQH